MTRLLAARAGAPIVATGISLGVPSVEIAVSSGAKSEGTFRDASVVDQAFSGLVEMLAPGDAPAIEDAGRSAGPDRSIGTGARASYDPAMLIGQWLEQVREACGAPGVGQLGVGQSTREAHATDSAPAMPDAPEVSEDTGVALAGATLAVPALPLVLAPVMPTPQPGAEETDATQASTADASETSTLPATETPLELAVAERRHDRGRAPLVTRSLSLPADPRGSTAGTSGVGEFEDSAVIDASQSTRPFHTVTRNDGPAREPAAATFPIVPHGANDLVSPQHAEMRQPAASTHVDEALAAATAELQRALSQRRGSSPTPSGSDLSTAESAEASEPRAFKPGGGETPASLLAGLGAGHPTPAAAWGGATGGELGRGRSDSDADPFLRRAPWPRPGTLGPAAGSVTAEPFALRDLTSIGARTLVMDVQAPSGTATPDLPQQVVRAVHLQWRQGIGEARLQLKPDHLGPLTVTLRVEGGLVTAVLRTESRLAMERIEANQQELRAALEQQGLRLDRLVVAVDPDARGRRQPAAAPFSERRDSRPEDGQPVFDLNDFAS